MKRGFDLAKTANTGWALFLAIFSLGAETFAQPGWFWQNPLPAGNTLNAVHFVDANIGIAVGDAGTILRTVDAGATWTIQTSGTTSSLFGVFFTDANTGTAVGIPGTILRTTNGGATWVSQTSGTSSTLQAVFFTTANIGTIVGAGGIILRTTNGGTTWTSQNAGTNNSLNAIAFTDVNTGTAVGLFGTILRTTNGGATWTSQSSGTTERLLGTAFANTNTGTVVGDKGTILHTTDAGVTWTSQISGKTGSLRSVAFIDANTGTVVGDNGSILRTTNGGATWTTQSSGTTSTLYSVAFINANIAATVGSFGTILRTTDSGANWMGQSRTVTARDLNGVAFANATTGTAVGNNGTILRTTNGGTTWATQSSGITTTLISVALTDANSGVAVGTVGTILRTTDGGTNWTRPSSGTTRDLVAIAFVDANTGTIVGGSLLNPTTGGGSILRTMDGGATWNSQTSGTNFLLSAVAFTDANTGTAVGYGGTILRTTNGGATWTKQTSGTTRDLTWVFFTDANTGIVVGKNGTILRTTNGGNTWTSQPSGTTANLWVVCFTEANTGTVVGNSGNILRTTDGGLTWKKQISGTVNHLFSVSFTDANIGTVVGETGTILRTGTGGATVSAPVLASPSHGAIGIATNPTLIWNAAAGATSYRLQVSTNPTFSTTVVDQSGIGGTSYQVNGLAGNTLYYWRVNASNLLETSAWSSVWTFTTTLAAPTLASPANGAINQPTTLALSWNSSTGATSYRLQVSTNSSFATTIFDDSTIVATSRQVGPLANNTTYYWRVKAKNIGGSSAWSSPARNFTTIVAPPSTPTLASPADGATNQSTTLTLSWNAAIGAETYRLQVSTNSNFATTVFDDSTITATSRQVGPLANNTTYYWRVKAKNIGGSSAWSSPARNFTTIVAPPSTPTLASPADGATNQPTILTLNWNAATGAETYRLQVSTNSNFVTPVFDDSTITATSRQVGPLANNTTYYWRVKAKNVGGSSAWSSPARNFTTIVAPPSTPTLASPADGATNQPTILTLNWNAATGAETYRLQVSTNSNFVTPVFDDSTITATSRQVGPLANNTAYYWRVKAKNIGGSSAWSSPARSFTTILQLPNQVLLISPDNFAAIKVDSLRFTWRQSAPAVSRYWFELATDSLRTNLFIDSTITDTTIVRRQLARNQNYWWWVRAGNTTGWGPFSAPRRFRTDIGTSVQAEADRPREFSLRQNYPNPFWSAATSRLAGNPSTTIEYTLPQAAHVELKVYDLRGHEVQVLVRAMQEAGKYAVQLNAANLPSSVYFYQLRAGEFMATKKLILLR